MTRILHFSDIHLPVRVRPFPPHHWANKRTVALVNYVLRRGTHFRGGARKLAELYSLVQELSVDMVVFSGDSVHFGTQAELQQARQQLEPFLALGPRFVHVAGNHDLYLPDTLRRSWYRKVFGPPPSLEQRNSEHPASDVAIVPLNSARPNPAVLRSSGRISDDDLRALPDVLGHSDLADRWVFLVTHYTLALPDGLPDTKAHGLTNARDLLEAIAPFESTILLSGHIHHGYHCGPPLLSHHNFCAGSATYRGRESAWLYDADQQSCRAQLYRWRESWQPEGAPITIKR